MRDIGAIVSDMETNTAITIIRNGRSDGNPIFLADDLPHQDVHEIVQRMANEIGADTGERWSISAARNGNIVAMFRSFGGEIEEA